MSKSASVRTRKRGKTYSYIFEAGKTPEGKRKVIEKGGYPTKQAAYDAGVAAYNDWKHGNIGITSDKIIVRDFINNWLDNVVALNVKPTTMQVYRDFTKYQIAPYLGNIQIQELTPIIFDKWLRGLLKSGFSKNTISHAYTFIRQALDYAVYPSGIINSNPANYVKVPKKAPTNIVKRHVISIERFNHLLEKYPFGNPYYIPLMILFYTGIRIGELIGLTWNDINFDQKTLSIRRQVTYLDRRGYFFTSPKTESSYRDMKVDDFFISELQRWMELQTENEQNLGGSYIYNYCDSSDRLIQQSKGLGKVQAEKMPLICTRENGKAVMGYSITKILIDEGLNAHSFRHTHATMLIENGATPKAVANRLGHSNISITQNIYTHATDKMDEDTSEIFTQIMQTNIHSRQYADKKIKMID